MPSIVSIVIGFTNSKKLEKPIPEVPCLTAMCSDSDTDDGFLSSLAQPSESMDGGQRASVRPDSVLPRHSGNQAGQPDQFFFDHAMQSSPVACEDSDLDMDCFMAAEKVPAPPIRPLAKSDANAEVDPANSFFDQDQPMPGSPTSSGGSEKPDMCLVPKPKRGRPKGTRGTQVLRSRRKVVVEDFENRQLVLAAPQPGSVEYARAAKKAKHERPFDISAFDMGVLPMDLHGPASTASLATSMLLLNSKSPVWQTMFKIGSSESRVVAVSAQHALVQLEDRLSKGEDVSLDSITHPVLPIVFQPNRHHVTDAQLASLIQDSRRNVRSILNQAASAALLSAGSLWGTLFDALCQKICSKEWQPILFIKKTRYDETPSKLRLRSEGETQAQSSTEPAKFAKAFQFELSFHILVRDIKNNVFLHLLGMVPCDLTVVDRTTAECTKAVILKHIEAVPELKRTADLFPVKFQLTTIDRYPANYKAERSIHWDDPTWKRATFPCNVHRLAQVSTVTVSLVERDVSGLIAASLAFDTAGVLHQMRAVLRSIFENELTVYFSSPPNEQHRVAVYDLFLPVYQEDLDRTSIRPPRKHHLLRMIQRAILDATLNGDIEGEEIQHFCTMGCCKDSRDTLKKFLDYTTFALLPHKLPRFPRTRWSNREASVCWSGHHGLLVRVIEKVAGKATVVSPTVAGDAPVSDTADETLEDLVANPFFGIRLQLPNAQPSPIADEGHLPGQDQPLEDAEVEGLSYGDTEEIVVGKLLDWTELNKQYRVKSVAWANSNPCPRLVLMQLVGKPWQNIMHKAFFLSGKAWDELQNLQEAKGLPRSYRVLEAAGGNWTKEFYPEVRKFLGLTEHLLKKPF